MRLSPRIMGKCGTTSTCSVAPFALVFLLISSLCISFSECKRSACWRYGHSCWGGHGKRSGGGLGERIGLSSTRPVMQRQGESRQFGMLDKVTGKFIALPALSMMLLHNRGSNMLHPQQHPNLIQDPPVGPLGLREIRDIPFHGVHHRPIWIKSKRSDRKGSDGSGGGARVTSGNYGGRDENNMDEFGSSSSSSSQQVQEDYNHSGSNSLGGNADHAESLLKSSKEGGLNQGDRQGEQRSMIGNEDSSSPSDYERASFLDNSIFVRDRRGAHPDEVVSSYTDEEISNSMESGSNSASEDHSQETHSLSSSPSSKSNSPSLKRQPTTGIYLDKMKSFQRFGSV